MPDCTIELSMFQDGFWQIRYTLITAQGTRCGPQVIEGEESMTEQALKDAILALY